MKAIKYLIAALLLAATAYAGWSWHLATHRQGWLWNEGLAHIQTEQEVGGLRLHIRLLADSLWQAYDTAAGPISIDSCFARMDRQGQSKMWLVTDSLDYEQTHSLVRTIVKSAMEHNIAANRIVVETNHWEIMRKLRLLDIHTAYSWNAPQPAELTELQRDSVVTRIYRSVHSGQVSMLAMPRAWYPYFHSQLSDFELQFLVIAPGASAFRSMLDPMTRVMMHDSQVAGMLIPSK